MSYDEKCYELADFFLATVWHRPKAVGLLAQEIQDVIEAFIADEEAMAKPEEKLP